MIYTEVSFPIRYYETDQMGIVHHSNYIRFFECARTELMRQVGCPMVKCEAAGFTFPVVSVECKYKHPAKMGDVITVVATIESMPMAKMYVKQRVLNQDGVLCAEGTVIVGFLDKATNRPIRCPQMIVEAFGKYLNDK